MLKKSLEKKMLKKDFWNNILGKKFWNKILEKSFDKRNFGKINYKRKIFITKIYSNIDKCHTIFALLAPSTKQSERQGVMKTYVAYDSK